MNFSTSKLSKLLSLSKSNLYALEFLIVDRTLLYSFNCPMFPKSLNNFDNFPFVSHFQQWNTQPCSIFVSRLYFPSLSIPSLDAQYGQQYDCHPLEYTSFLGSPSKSISNVRILSISYSNIGFC